MIVWTVHTKPAQPPVLVREGFSWGGFVFGPFWLLARRAWVPGVIALAADIVIALLPLGRSGAVLGFGISWVIGVFGRDLLRWTLDNRGFALVHLVAERDVDSALARLLERRPDLVGDALINEVVR